MKYRVRDKKGKAATVGNAVRIELSPDGDLWIGKFIDPSNSRVGVAFLKYAGEVGSLEIFDEGADDGEE